MDSFALYILGLRKIRSTETKRNPNLNTNTNPNSKPTYK